MNTQIEQPHHRLPLQQRIRRHPWWTAAIVCGVLAIPGAAVSLTSNHATSTTAAINTSTSAHAAMFSASNASSSSSSASSSPTQSIEAAAAGVTQGSASSSPANANYAAKTSSPTGGHDVIETATIAIRASHLSTTTSRLTQMATAAGGFVSSMQDNQGVQNGPNVPVANNQKETVHMVLRVPEVAFSSFVRGARGLGHVDSFSETGQDVTQQHNDLASQLDLLNSEGTAYQRLFDKATSMKDMLQIEQSIAEVNNQIASLNGQLDNLDKAVQLSTVDVTITPTAVAKAKPVSPAAGALIQSIHFMGKSARGLLVFVAWVLPWVALGTVVRLVWLKWPRKSRSRHEGE